MTEERTIDTLLSDPSTRPVEVSVAVSQVERSLPVSVREEVPVSGEMLSLPVAIAAPAEEGYDDRGFLGRGGMGEVRYVIDRRLMRSMALKMLAPGSSEHPESVLRFIEEAQITGQLDHPNIVPVHALGVEEDGTLYFTMKLVRGKTLAQILKELGSSRFDGTNLEQLIGILLKVCDAISFAHSRGVIHRDLKSSNVMVGSHGQVYVMDWGLALLKHGPRLVSDEGVLIGTPGFMAPEQAEKRVADMDERTDVYGLGGILYRVLTLGVPHPGADEQEIIAHTIGGEVREPREYLGGETMPPELCRIAMKALEREREHRYQNIDELRADLEQFNRGGGWLATRTFKAGELLMREGDEPDEAYVIVQGECEAFKMVGGKRQTLRRMGRGEVIGETGLLTAKARTATVEAIVAVTVKVVTRDALERELERNTWMGAFVRVLAERFRELDARVVVGDGHK